MLFTKPFPGLLCIFCPFITEGPEKDLAPGFVAFLSTVILSFTEKSWLMFQGNSALVGMITVGRDRSPLQSDELHSLRI